MASIEAGLAEEPVSLHPISTGGNYMKITTCSFASAVANCKKLITICTIQGWGNHIDFKNCKKSVSDIFTFSSAVHDIIYTCLSHFEKQSCFSSLFSTLNSIWLYDSLFNCKNFPFLFFLIHVLFPVQQQTYILFKQKCIIFGCVDEYFQINTFDFTDPELTFGHI